MQSEMGLSINSFYEFLLTVMMRQLDVLWFHYQDSCQKKYHETDQFPKADSHKYDSKHRYLNQHRFLRKV